ncbi:MAG: hypothetical protein KIS80_10045 [Anaerolineales bacterium]|nr:hypothetical protein [Anaerolineales bacterium]
METSNYMILGFAVVFAVMLLHLISLPLRYRNLQADLAVLEEQKPAKKAAPKKKPAAKKRK